jgi:hypothetical protein
MRAARFLPLVALAAAAILSGSAGAASLQAPTGLHAFLLRADDPPTTVFSRTPSFAWDPVPGATGYEFQLSTSNTFSNGTNDSVSDNGIWYDTNSLTSPVVAPPLDLPWITGSPHSLYARVRATTPDGVTPWSADFGFDMQPDPLLPTPMSTDGLPGLLRWTPVEGADAYQIWFTDLPHNYIVTTRTNVLDEREFYSFHGSLAWIGTIHWRIRAVRSTELGKPANGFPVSSYSQWSPIYTSTNPAMTAGPLTLGKTISDVEEDGSANSSQPAHKLMPAFTWSGNQVTLPNGTSVTAELFRVELYADKGCQNLIYAGPIVGGLSWAPRPFGSMSLPDPSAFASARSSYPSEGAQGLSETYDGSTIGNVEDLGAASPTSAAPADAIPSGASQSVSAATDPATFAPAKGDAPLIGAPVDLWDSYWPSSGYYWTVMPVGTSGNGSSATVAAPGASKGSTLLPVSDSSSFVAGQTITIGTAPNSDTATVTSVGNGLLTLGSALNLGHAAGESIVVLGGSGGSYHDLVLPQDLCAMPGMLHQVGIWSEPTLTSPQAPFVSGLSSDGKLVAASSSTQFYGKPLVAWEPALRAEKYEIEWSQSDSPFVATGNLLTTQTAAVLPLSAGTWYYRIRGFDYNLPTGAQQMAWSPPQKLVLAKPQFKVVIGKVSPSSKPVFKVTTPKAKTAPKKSSTAAMVQVRGSGFSLSVPSAWHKLSFADGHLGYGATGTTATVEVMHEKPAPQGEAAGIVLVLQNSATVTQSNVTLPAGKAILLTAQPKTGQSHLLFYVVAASDGGSYVVGFSAKTSAAYTANSAFFSKMLTSFKLG